METITLQCWVYRDDANNIFPVEIPKNKTVGFLKKVIKDETPEFRDVDAKHIRPYTFFLGDEDEQIDGKLKQLSLADKSCLNSRTKVSKIFPEDNQREEEWLIVIDGPNSGSSVTEPPIAVISDMTLFCWVRDDMRGSILPVEISSTRTVADLKEIIKNKKPVYFRDVDSDDLTLYKSLLPYGEDDSLEGVLGTRTISSLGNPLRDSQKLSAIFMPLSADHQLHLIVDGLVSLQCWIRGAEPSNSFSVRIPTKASVDDLKNVIKAAYGEALDGLSPDHLKLYKILVNEEAELGDRLSALGSGRLLRGNELVHSVFDDVPFFQRPRVIVEPLHKTRSTATVPSAIHPRLQYIQAWVRNPPKSPSRQGEASNFNTLQATDCRVDWTRPPDGGFTIPVTLLHPIFGQFVDDCDTHEPTSEENTLVLDLSLQMSDFFVNERRRQKGFIDILRSRGIGIVPSSFAGYHTDGDLHVNGRRYVILEVKSEVGSKGAEPYCQAILYYIGASQGEVEKAFNRKVQFNFPCLIITLFGPHLGFSGAVWANRPNYQVLSTVLPLFWHPTDVKMRQSAARHIGAFMKALRSLQELFEKFDKTPADFKELQPEFPHPRCYTNLDEENQEHFRYIRALEGSKLLFVVTTDTGKQLCVKFVQSYARTVHERCAAWGVSPSLRGFDAIPGGWHMVVMDLLEGYECLHDVKHSLSREQKERLREELRSKLTDLHQMNFVHGDVRDANVMIGKDRSEWKLVDFDWSGKIGEVRYPMNVNRGLGLRRPEGVLDGKLILADHDIKMLDYLFD